MKTRLAALVAALVPLLAHHSIQASYETGKTMVLQGVVTKFDWANPHVYVFVDAPDGQNWAVEFASTLDMKRAGWNKDSVNVGATVTVTANPARDGSRELWGRSLRIGARTLGTDFRPAAFSKTGKPAPRYPDGHIRLTAEPGQIGYWAYPTAGFAEGKVRMDDEGILVNVTDIAKVAPFQPWALGLYTHRQLNKLKDDPMASCLPPGGPRQFQAPYGLQFLEDRDRKRLFVFSGGGNRNWRLIYFDGRPLPNVENETPTYYGFSTAKWDGDRISIQTIGFNERFWFANGGLPHTESLELTEKISRPDFDTLRYEVMVNDPGAYTRPWSTSWNLRWVPGEEIAEYFCDDYNLEQQREFAK